MIYVEKVEILTEFIFTALQCAKFSANSIVLFYPVLLFAGLPGSGVGSTRQGFIS